MIRSIVSQLSLKMPLRLYKLSVLKGVPSQHFRTARNLESMQINYRTYFSFATGSQQREE